VREILRTRWRLKARQMVVKPISDEAKRRVREALRRAVKEELDAQTQIFGPERAKPAIVGPWNMLTSDSGVWDAEAHPSAELYRQIRGRLSDTSVKELLLAVAGVKVSRLSVADAELQFLRCLAEQHGFFLLASHERYLPLRDVGKGNYCNGFERVVGPDEARGLRNVYIASDKSLVEAAKLLEEAVDDELFGALLGIPHCCRNAYERFLPIASAKQFDLVPLVLDDTPGPLSYDSWLNYPAVYFGRSLLSFFPCSFRCKAAHAVARSTYGMLAECDEAWAISFLDLQHSNILYTEYQGVHLFRQPLIDGWIRYGPDDFNSTEPTALAALIRRGDRLEVRGKRLVNIYSGSDRIGILQGEDIGMCVFFEISSQDSQFRDLANV
jgi:hypothetical protein